MSEKESGEIVELNNMDILFQMKPYTFYMDVDVNITTDGKPYVVTTDLDLKRIMECIDDYESLVDPEDLIDDMIILEVPDCAYGMTVKSKLANDSGEPTVYEETYSHREILNMRKEYLRIDPDEMLRKRFVVSPLLLSYTENTEGLSWEEYREKYGKADDDN